MSSFPDLAASTSARFDTTRVVETPEGCLLTLRVAGPHARARAWLLDLCVRAVAYIVVAGALTLLGGFGLGLLLIAVFGLEWGYPIWFELRSDGQTPGKRMCGLVVVHDDGTPVRATASVVRNLLRAVDFLPVGYVVGAIAMLVQGGGRRLGDLAAGTLVVHVDATARAAASVEATQAEPLRVALTPAERRAVVDFAMRQSRLTPARAEELAQLATPLVTHVPSGQAAAHLRRLARTIAGVDTT